MKKMTPPSGNTHAGFIDLQVNGFLGISFTSSNLTVDAVRRVTQELLSRGTVAYCPTICTAAPAVYEAAIPVLLQAMREPDLRGHLLGIHLEGPFFTPASRGAHPERLLRRPDPALFDRWQTLAEGNVRILTLAPELEGAEALIRHVSRQGTLVSLGHHLADDATIERAVKAGATCCTHVGNGISQMQPRHPNPIWTQLSRDDLVNMFITDGHHLPDEFIRVAWRAKTVDRFIVVSDSASLAGLPPGKYSDDDDGVVIEPSGRIVMANGWSLAGSSAAMIDCMNHLGALGLLSEADLLRVGRGNPLRLIGNPAVGDLPAGPVRVENDNGRIKFSMP